MSYPVSLEKVLLKARRRANLETAGTTPDDFITDAEAIDDFNTSFAEWWDEVRATTFNGQMFRRRMNFTTTPSVQSSSAAPPPGAFYPLPPNFLHLISVDIAIGNNLVITAKAFQEEQRNVYRFYPVGAWVWNQPVFYQVQENNIVFVPAPTGTYNVQINYCPTAPRLTKPQDSFDSINSWEEFIVCDLAAKWLVKDGQLDVVQIVQAERERQRMRIRSLVPKRDMQTSEMVHEVNEFDDQWIL